MGLGREQWRQRYQAKAGSDLFLTVSIASADIAISRIRLIAHSSQHATIISHPVGVGKVMLNAVFYALLRMRRSMAVASLCQWHHDPPNIAVVTSAHGTVTDELNATKTRSPLA